VSARRVLVVDDDRDSANLLKVVVEIHGNEAREAHDAREARAIAAEFQPEIAFLDIGLPDENGFDLARGLRATPGLERTVLVAVTGFDDPDDKHRAREAGFDHFLVKPFDPDEVARLL